MHQPGLPSPPPPGIGYASQMIVTLLNIYYIIVLAWALFYLFSSFTVDLPWGSCRHDWNTGEVTPSCLAAVTRERDRPCTLGPGPQGCSRSLPRTSRRSYTKDKSKNPPASQGKCHRPFFKKQFYLFIVCLCWVFAAASAFLSW